MTATFSYSPDMAYWLDPVDRAAWAREQNARLRTQLQVTGSLVQEPAGTNTRYQGYLLGAGGNLQGAGGTASVVTPAIVAESGDYEIVDFPLSTDERAALVLSEQLVQEGRDRERGEAQAQIAAHGGDVEVL